MGNSFSKKDHFLFDLVKKGLIFALTEKTLLETDQI
jgi:hypothetical protein